MINLKKLEVWFVTGSQHLYGPETLKKVAAHSQEIAKTLSGSAATCRSVSGPYRPWLPVTNHTSRD